MKRLRLGLFLVVTVVILFLAIFLPIWLTRTVTTTFVTPTSSELDEKLIASVEDSILHAVENHDESVLLEKLKETVELERLPTEQSRSPPTKLPCLIQRVIYINHSEGALNRAVESQIRLLGLAPEIPRDRMTALKRLDPKIGRILSHVGALSKVMGAKQHTLILEDDFVLDELLMGSWQLRTNEMAELLSNRWDVMAFGGSAESWESWGPNRCRLLEADCGRGYLVHHAYIPILFSQLVQKLRQTLSEKLSSKMPAALAPLQAQDTWVSWPDVLTIESNAQQDLHIKKVAICHIAIGTEYAAHVKTAQREAFLQFLKPHALEFFLITDQPELYPLKMTEEGSPLRVFAASSTFTSRFSLLQTIMHALTQYDFVFYCDVDYSIYSRLRGPLANEELLVEGLVAGTPLHSPEYVSRFHGGAVQPYLQLCESLALSAGGNDDQKLNNYLSLINPITVLFLDADIHE